MNRLHTIEELLTLELEHSGNAERRIKCVETLISALDPVRVGPLGHLGQPPQLADLMLHGTPSDTHKSYRDAHQQAEEHMISDREQDRNTFKDLAKLAGATKPEAAHDDDGVIDFAALAAAAVAPPPPSAPLGAPPSAPPSAKVVDAVAPSIAPSIALPPVERAPRVSQPPVAVAPAPVESVPARGDDRKKAPVIPIAIAAAAVAAVVAFVAVRSVDQKIASNVTNNGQAAAQQGTLPQAGEPAPVVADRVADPKVVKAATTASAKLAPLASAEKAAEKPEEKKPEEVKVEAPVASATPPVAAPGDPASLEEQIRRAAGGAAKTDTPAAAAGPDTTGLPTKPSQGAVRGAVGAVLGGARACLTADDPVAHATVTFGSSGGVQGVSVSGGGGKDGCIRGALSRARVAPFSQPSFSTSVTVRGD